MKPKITLRLTLKIRIFKVRVQNKVKVKKVKTPGFLLQKGFFKLTAEYNLFHLQ